jgi:hypothetical protein
MHVTYGRERSKTTRRATADIVSNSAQRGLDEGRNKPLTAYIITADGRELYGDQKQLAPIDQAVPNFLRQ